MFEGKTLVGVGCSHVFGTLLDDTDPITCHPRSWVKKLERLGNFKNSINLGSPGGSNNKSERILFEYLKDNYSENLVVIFSITQLARKEFVRNYNDSIDYIDLGSWMIDVNNPDIVAEDEFTAERRKENASRFGPKAKTFFEIYYSLFHHHDNDVQEINRRVLMIHTLLKSLNIEHYFFEMIAEPGTINQFQLGHNIPMIKFKTNLPYDINANNYLNFNNIIPEKCRHWDHAGNEFLAEYLLSQIKEMRNV